MLDRLWSLLGRRGRTRSDPAEELERERRLAEATRDAERFRDQVLDDQQHYVARQGGGGLPPPRAG